MTSKELLRDRTKMLGLRIIRLVDTLPKSGSAKIIGNQLLRAGLSIGANYRAACRGRSTVDMIAKLKIVEEEADECAFWMETLCDSGIVASGKMTAIMGETNEILAMTVASIKTLRSKRRQTVSDRR